jgi:ribonuclease R
MGKKAKKKIVGKVIAHPSGFGFLQSEELEKDLYIPPKYMKYLLDGDKVLAQIKIYKGKPEAQIIRVLKRFSKNILGRIEKIGKKCYISPIDANQHLKFLVSQKACKKYKRGTVVDCEIVKYPTKRQKGRVKIKEVLGHPDEKSLIVDIVIRKYNLPVDYPKEVKEEVNKIPDEIPKEEIERRKDLREQLCFTIDPERARDFDDAVAIEENEKGYKLWVHIADVSYFVKPNTALDKNAYERSFTFYLPDRALHMLPEKLSARLCSLRPNEDRLAFTVEMQFDKEGNLLDYSIYESVIRSKARLTYDQALRLIMGDPGLEEKYPQIAAALRIMAKLARILNKKRHERGSIDFDLPEVEVLVDEYGEPMAILPYERHFAHKIIEEFMIAANETVAKHMENLGYPCLFRVHEEPDPKKVERLLNILSRLGYQVKKVKPPYHPKFFQKIIEDFEGTNEEMLVRYLTLRAMKRAYYSPINIGHFGLASRSYLHFTSPIRRYPDLIVHRLVKMSLRGEIPDLKYWEKYLELAGEHCSAQEQLADEVEEEAIERLKIRMLKAYIGDIFEGIITGVHPYGFFVELKDFLIDGLVPIETLKDDEYIYDDENQQLLGKNSGKSFRLGDPVKVQLVRADEEKMKIDLKVAQ